MRSLWVDILYRQALETDNDVQSLRQHTPERDRAYVSVLTVLKRMWSVLAASVFSSVPLSHVGGFGPQTDEGTAMRAMGDPAVRDMLAQVEAQWGMSPAQVLSVDYRSRMGRNVLAAYPS